MKRNKVKSIFKDSVAILLISFIFLFLVEGFSSFMIVFYNLTKKKQIIAEEIHTEYDSLLGWINKRNWFIQDMYGPKKYLRTNSQRFRNNHDFDIAVPNGKKRWICAGDSFTLGYGVDNDHTWCSLLTSNVPKIETINMGQGGYGIDQAYLWYMRDGAQLQHDVLILAFITLDFDRMNSNRFGSYSKPRLSVLNGQIIQQNVPVPRPGFLAKYLPRYKSAIKKLSVVKLMLFLRHRFKDNDSKIESEMNKLTLSIIRNLNNINKKIDRTVLLVHLPMRKDYKNSQHSDFWRDFLHSHAKKNGWNYIDMIEDFRNLNSESVPELFIQNDLPGLIGSSGHYTEKGNHYIADLLVKKIASSPSTMDLVQTSK